MEYGIQVAQIFYCTYNVFAESETEAWELLMNGEGECEYQMPGDIISSREESSIELYPT